MNWLESESYGRKSYMSEGSAPVQAQIRWSDSSNHHWSVMIHIELPFLNSYRLHSITYHKTVLDAMKHVDSIMAQQREKFIDLVSQIDENSGPHMVSRVLRDKRQFHLFEETESCVDCKSFNRRTGCCMKRQEFLTSFEACEQFKKRKDE